jgi:LuxR family maltose regulon positive regulatory protein
MSWTEANIALAKITLPGRRSTTIVRDRLLQALDQSLTGKLTVVHAPAGYGKTSLLADWGQSAKFPVSWLSLDAADNDGSRYWRCLTHAIAKSMDEGARARLYRLAEAMSSVSRLAYIDALLNELSNAREPLLCIIDDYHVIASEQLHEHMAYFIDYLPDGFHLALASRQPLPFPTMKLKLRGEATELNVSDLRFTLEESELLLRESEQGAGSRPSVDRLALLLERTEGWITGILLIQVLVRSGQTMEAALRSFRGHERHVSDYLFQEAVASLPAGLRSFLLQTSVLAGFDETICNELTGRDDAGDMLKRIHEHNLFLLPLDESARRYRYHRLFSEYWADSYQREQPDSWRRTHLHASVLLAERGMLREAIGHASLAGDYKAMEGLLARHIPDVLRQGELTTLLGWFGSFPADYPLSPELSLLHAFVLVLTGQPVPAENLLQKLELLLEQSDGSAPERDVGLRSGILFVRSNLVFTSGEYEKWLAFSNGILNQLVPENPTFYNFNYNLKEPLVRKTVMGMNGVLSPQTEAIAGLFSGTMDSHGWDRSLINLYVKQSLAEGYYEWNRLADSLKLLRGIEQAVESRGVPGLLIPHRLTEAAIHSATGDAAQAELLIDDALRFASGLEDKRWLAVVHAYKTRHALQSDQLSQAKASAKHLAVTAKAVPTFAQEYEYLTLARLLGRQRKEKEALRLLELLKPQARREGQLGSLAEHALLQAMFEFKLGNRGMAWGYLEEALAIGAANGYVRTFADEGEEAGELLRRYRNREGGIAAEQATGKRRKDDVRIAHASVAPASVAHASATQASVAHASTAQASVAHASAALSLPLETTSTTMTAMESDKGGLPNEIPLEYVDKLIEACPVRAIPAAKNEPVEQESLTRSELELLRQLRLGASNKQISAALHLSEGTVKVYLSNLYGKLGVSSRTQALLAAQERGLL